LLRVGILSCSGQSVEECFNLPQLFENFTRTAIGVVFQTYRQILPRTLLKVSHLKPECLLPPYLENQKDTPKQFNTIKPHLLSGYIVSFISLRSEK